LTRAYLGQQTPESVHNWCEIQGRHAIHRVLFYHAAAIKQFIYRQKLWGLRNRACLGMGFALVLRQMCA